jgi:hypothetical protein
MILIRYFQQKLGAKLQWNTHDRSSIGFPCLLNYQVNVQGDKFHRMGCVCVCVCVLHLLHNLMQTICSLQTINCAPIYNWGVCLCVCVTLQDLIYEAISVCKTLKFMTLIY